MNSPLENNKKVIQSTVSYYCTYWTLSAKSPVLQANALSIPPEEYGRKVKTQMNRRGPAQAVDHVV